MAIALDRDHPSRRLRHGPIELCGVANVLAVHLIDNVAWPEPDTRRYTAIVETNQGTFTMELLADQSPATVNVFVFLARERFWDGLRFHRVVANFVAQTGDPTGEGSGGAGFETEQEPNAMKNTRGTVAMARAAFRPSSSTARHRACRSAPTKRRWAGTRSRRGR